MSEQNAKVVQSVNPADISISIKRGSDFGNSSFVISAPGHDPVEIPFLAVEEWSKKKKIE